jgi:hypothetical protein
MTPRVCRLALFLAAGLAAASDQAASRHAKHDVVADTDPNSGFWRRAPAIFIESDSRGNPVPGFRTEVRSRWTGANLYFLFTCPFEELYLKPDPRTGVETNELWNWDVAEAFIGSDFHNIRKYKEFEVSPQAEWVDLDVDLDAPRHEDGWKWNSGFQTAARIDRGAKHWYAFMRIPYTAIDSRPATAGNVLRVNFFLSEGRPPNHKGMTWRPTGRDSFHVPEAFGSLRLAP